MTVTTDPSDTRVATAVAAARARESEFEAIERNRSEQRRETNARFAAVVQQQVAEGASMVAIARAIGISRQVLHDLVRNHGQSAT